jgi:ABC-type uncharacterized transport system substrate-binding protein
MKRRKFVAIVGTAAITWPFAARGEPTRRIGALFVGNADIDTFRTTLREGLRKSGYVEGRNLVLEFRSAEEKLDRLPKLATELVALKVDVMVALYTPVHWQRSRRRVRFPSWLYRAIRSEPGSCRV